MMMAMRRSAITFAVLLLCPLIYGHAQDQDASTPPPPATPKKAPSEPTLPRGVILPLKTVKESFPAVTQQLDTGPDTVATPKPTISRLTVYASRDGVNKVTLTVDEYQYGSEASLAYEQAAQKTQLPDFEPIAIANVGQRVFGGTLKQGGETQILIVVLEDRIVVGAVLSGFDNTTDNISKLAELMRLQVADLHIRPSSRKR